MEKTIPVCLCCCRIPVTRAGQGLGFYFIYNALRLLMQIKRAAALTGVSEKFIVAQAAIIILCAVIWIYGVRETKQNLLLPPIFLQLMSVIYNVTSYVLVVTSPHPVDEFDLYFFPILIFIEFYLWILMVLIYQGIKEMAQEPRNQATMQVMLAA